MDPMENTAHEAYSFVCMRCGHGWEQEYEIEHLEYPDGSPFVTYHSGGKRVASPLKHPTCVACDGHQVRIMRSGRVSGVSALAPQPRNGAAARAPRKGTAGAPSLRHRR